MTGGGGMQRVLRVDAMAGGGKQAATAGGYLHVSSLQASRLARRPAHWGARAPAAARPSSCACLPLCLSVQQRTQATPCAP